MSENTPPPLPPRKSIVPSESVSPSASGPSRDIAEETASTGPAIIESDYVRVASPDIASDRAGVTASPPPPLPPRKSVVAASTAPLPTMSGVPEVFNEAGPSTARSNQAAGAAVGPTPATAPLPRSPLAVEIIPATPQPSSPASATASSAPGTIPDPPHTSVPPPNPGSGPSPLSNDLLSTPPATAPPALSTESTLSPPPASSTATGPPQPVENPLQAAKQAVAEVKHGVEKTDFPIGWTALVGALVLLGYMRILPLWMTMGLVAGVGFLQAQNTKMERDKEEQDGDVVLGRMKGDAKAAVQWVNHALYALFPLISTDVLTPFIDLLEDALIQKVPPIVTSVRLDAPALGNQPLLLTSMRPMTDEEWFATVSTPSKDTQKPPEESSASPLKPGPGKGHRKSLSADMARDRPEKDTATGTHPANPKSRGSHSRSPSDASMSEAPPSVTGSPRMSRSASRGSVVSFVDAGEVKEETEKRRKRDRVLNRIRRRQNRQMTHLEENEADPLDPRSQISQPIREGAPPGLHSHVQTASGAAVDDELDEDNPLTGQYVNFQVGFEYHRRETTKRKGYGLHVLAYFGVGVKGIGKTELPVYIDMLSIKGTLNIRLLLSANPPFARTATISFPRLPEFDISAKPLTRSTFNAMHLPGMKPYVQASIAEVARAFVRPNSYTVDVDRLLLGREAALRTATIGVLHLIIHSAEDLAKTDTVGSCDPYVTASFAKYHKPMFSTRTIIDNQNPSWDEPAFLLVTSDEIETGESLRLRICDSDRFSADDAVGQVEVELAELIERTSDSSEPIRRTDPLQADRPGMRVQGSLTWSVRFAPLWQMPAPELERRMKELKTSRKGECKDDKLPWWMEWMTQIAGEKPDWAKEREERNKETAAWFTGEKEKDELEAQAKPTESLRSGVLQFHIHQAVDLELESLDGTYSASSSARKSAAGGKPALSDVVDRTPAENPEPPSAYVEVHLNDRLVYRTRTKQMTPMPYFNAVSERFLRDWRMAKMVLVVRDERDREHDPILGLVTLRLEEVFKDRSQFTRWYPIIGGLGWGRIRISLLFKPIDLDLPARISGFEIATFELKSVSATDLSHLAEKKGIAVSLETEADRVTLTSEEMEAPSASGTPNRPRSVSASIASPPPSTTSTQHIPLPVPGENDGEMEWELARPIRLAVEYRHSCSVLISFITRTGVMRKKRVVGLAAVRLNDVEDWVDISRTVPIFGTASVKDAIAANQNYTDVQAGNLALARLPSRDINIIGFVSVDFRLRPGVSRAHKKLGKKDMRFKRVYEAWEMEREVRAGLSEMSAKDAFRADRPHLRSGAGGAGGDDDDDDEDDDDEENALDEEGSESEDDARKAEIRRTPSGRTTASARRQMDESDDELGISERKAHSQALHKRNKGIFQLKIARTGKFVKDQIEAKLYARAKDRRMRGADLDVEQEGQSKL